RRGLAGIEDLRTALQLVRGAPLADATDLAEASARPPYSWLPGSAIEPALLLAGVVDTAHQLVDLCLQTGDLETARWAVKQAWLADPHRSDDHPWRALLRIAQAEGDSERAKTVIRALSRWRDAGHPDELAPVTRDLIRALLAQQPANAVDRRRPPRSPGPPRPAQPLPPNWTPGFRFPGKGRRGGERRRCPPTHPQSIPRNWPVWPSWTPKKS